VKIFLVSIRRDGLRGDLEEQQMLKMSEFFQQQNLASPEIKILAPDKVGLFGGLISHLQKSLAGSEYIPTPWVVSVRDHLVFDRLELFCKEHSECKTIIIVSYISDVKILVYKWNMKYRKAFRQTCFGSDGVREGSVHLVDTTTRTVKRLY